MGATGCKRPKADFPVNFSIGVAGEKPVLGGKPDVAAALKRKTVQKHFAFEFGWYRE